MTSLLSDFLLFFFFFFKQKTAYEMRISDWSSDVCSSDLKFRYVNPFKSTSTNKQLFDKLVKDFGPYMPFNSVAEMVEAQTGHALPKEIKEISAKISWMEATSKLRWFETVHALMNFGSLINNMPAIHKGMQRLKRSEEHTSETQSHKRISYAVFCLKKKNTKTKQNK